MTETIKNITSAEYLLSRLIKACDSVKHEKNGNIIGFVKGKCGNTPIMLATHYDLPHFLCTGVEGEKVFLVHVGNCKGDKWESCTVVSEKGVKAVISDVEDKLSASVDGEAVGVTAGDVFYVDSSVTYTDGNITSYGISSAAPAAALLLAAEKVSKSRPPRDVYFAFTTEGQYSYKLYANAAKKCGSAEAVCVGAVDVKESDKTAVRLCDRSFSSDKHLSNRLISVGAVPVAIREGKCAAGTVQVWGIPTAELDLPVSEAGGLNESVKEEDIRNAADILARFCNNSN